MNPSALRPHGISDVGQNKIMGQVSTNPQHDQYRRRHKLFGWIFAGCGTILGVGIVVALLFIGLMSRGRAEFTPILEEYLVLVEQGKFERAYDSLGDQWKAANAFDEFRDFILLVSDALGDYESAEMTSVHYRNNLGSPAWVVAVFTSTFEKASAKLTVNFQKYGDEWRIEGIDYQSEAIVSKLTCPHCGTVNGFDSFHCSTCGVKIERLKNDRGRDAV